MARNLLRRWLTRLSLHSQASRGKACDYWLDGHLGEGLSSVSVQPNVHAKNKAETLGKLKAQLESTGTA